MWELHLPCDFHLAFHQSKFPAVLRWQEHNNMIDWKNPASWSVLVVDDEPDNLDLVAIFLEFKGAKVKTASNGQDALNSLEKFKPNLILLDLSMPHMSGWDVHAALQANPATKVIWT